MITERPDTICRCRHRRDQHSKNGVCRYAVSEMSPFGARKDNHCSCSNVREHLPPVHRLVGWCHLCEQQVWVLRELPPGTDDNPNQVVVDDCPDCRSGVMILFEKPKPPEPPPPLTVDGIRIIVSPLDIPAALD